MTIVNWFGQPAHEQWLRNEESRLVSFAKHVVQPDGTAAWLDEQGRPDPAQPSPTWITARMAHVHFLASMRGTPGAYTRASELLQGLTGVARDHTHGGWHEQVPFAKDGHKTGYIHAFVVLAASTATMAGHPDGPALLSDALGIIDEHFWNAEHGLIVDTFSRDWAVLDEYRGINANMHMLEALLAAYDATNDMVLRDRALGICRQVIYFAAAREWRIPEHFDSGWQPLPEYNKDNPADQFKPYGATVGHGFEWSRLIAQASIHASPEEQEAFMAAAAELFARADEDGWYRDGVPGFVYTTDWEGRPVVSDRLHWVVAEAIAAAAVLHALTGNTDLIKKYAAWWDYAAEYLIDDDHGSWYHQLDSGNVRTQSVWPGKPDLYHAYQAVLIPQLPPAASVAGAIASTYRSKTTEVSYL